MRRTVARNVPIVLMLAGGVLLASSPAVRAATDGAVANLRAFVFEDSSFEPYLRDTYGIERDALEFVEGDPIWEGTAREGEPVRHEVELTAGDRRFVIVGAGCDGVVDLDLRVRDDEGELLDVDEADGRHPVCAFRVVEEATVEVEVRVEETDASEEGTGHFAFAILWEE